MSQPGVIWMIYIMYIIILDKRGVRAHTQGEQPRTSNHKHNLNHNNLSDEVASGRLNSRKVKLPR